MIKQMARKELTQCQHCWKSRLDLAKGVSLSKCAGCQIAMYCSKECQKAAWPAHKTLCRLNSAQRAAMPHQYQTDSLNQLRGFCAKHRPSFAQFGINAFDLTLDVTRCLRKVLLIRAAPNPAWDHKKAERAFLAVDAELAPVEMFGDDKGEELREQIKAFHSEQRRVGALGGFMVLVWDQSSGVSNVCGVGFGSVIFNDLKVGREWKAPLLLALNTGKVF